MPTPHEAAAGTAVPHSVRDTDVSGRCKDLIERRPDLRSLPLPGVVLAEAVGSA